VGSLILGTVIGMVIAIARLSKHAICSWPAAIYVEIIRDTPALLQLFIIYFGLAGYGIKLDPLSASILTLGIIGGAYLSEVFRAGIQSVERGQIEAALSIGMRDHQVMRRVILPQAFLLILPPFGNFLIALIKDTSLVLTISVPEIMYQSYNVASQTYRSMEVYALAAIIYFGLCFPLSRFAKWLEKLRPPP
jgi:His/Glu/Gln/Arg/opine family amino acid ABC transporter permease subunit